MQYENKQSKTQNAPEEDRAWNPQIGQGALQYHIDRSMFARPYCENHLKVSGSSPRYSRSRYRLKSPQNKKDETLYKYGMNVVHFERMVLVWRGKQGAYTNEFLRRTVINIPPYTTSDYESERPQ